MKRKIPMVFQLIVFISISVFSQTSISAEAKEKAINRIVKKIKKEGYAYNENFRDIDFRIRNNSKYIDTTSSVETFSLTINNILGQVLSCESFKLNKGLVLFYPTGEYLRLNGERLEGNGCIPDILLTREETANTEFILDVIQSDILD